MGAYKNKENTKVIKIGNRSVRVYEKTHNAISEEKKKIIKSLGTPDVKLSDEFVFWAMVQNMMRRYEIPNNYEGVQGFVNIMDLIARWGYADQELFEKRAIEIHKKMEKIKNGK